MVARMEVHSLVSLLDDRRKGTSCCYKPLYPNRGQWLLYRVCDVVKTTFLPSPLHKGWGQSAWKRCWRTSRRKAAAKNFEKNALRLICHRYHDRSVFDYLAWFKKCSDRWSVRTFCQKLNWKLFFSVSVQISNRTRTRSFDLSDGASKKSECQKSETQNMP